MYRVDDVDKAVRNVQRLLGTKKSGVYDDDTRARVIALQQKYGIAESGVVDLVTFEVIRDEHYIKQRQRLHVDVDGINRFPYSSGDFGSDVRIINSLLSEVLESYSIDAIGVRGSIYTAATLRAVMSLQRIFGFDERDLIDEILYERIKRESLTRMLVNGE